MIEEIKRAPESLVREAYDFVLFLKERRKRTPFSPAMPDFSARRKSLFGDRVLPDSQALLDELRAERF